MRLGSLTDVPPEQRRPLKRVEYDKLAEIGAFGEEKIELLYGAILRKSPIGAPHSSALQRLNELLVLALHGHATIRIQSPFAASDTSEPEPDAAVVPPGRYADAHPSQAWLLVEVADSSLAVDRGVKARLYAECGIPEYWVVNLVDGLIEVHTSIVRGVYTRTVPFKKGESIRLQQFGDVQIAVDDVLP